MGFTTSDGFANIINGQKVTSPTLQGIINPSTEEVFAHVPVATRKQLEDAIDAAEKAFPLWKATTWEERQKMLIDLAALVEGEAEQFTQLLMREVGKDQVGAAFEMGGVGPWLRTVAKQKLHAEILQDGDKLVKTRYRPFGVCGAIIPFNFPVALTVLKMSHALLAGNCLIIKAPPTAPCCVIKFAELAQAVLPPGVFSVLCGGNELGEWIVQHPRIVRVSMTGSTTAGKAIMRGASAELKSVTLELGGNDPAIVLDDVDPKEAAQRILLGATSNAGQICFAMKRIYIHENVYDAVREELVKLAKTTIKIGDPFNSEVTMGPVHNKGQYERLQGFLQDCFDQGYKIAFQSEKPMPEKGYFIPLTIVDNPPDDSRIVREEQFGPIIPLLRWSEDEEVVQRANRSEYGLGSSVWGKDKERTERIADSLCNGMVWINDWGVVSADIPVSGIKHSGVGVESSSHGLAEWTYIQSLVCNKVA